MTTKYGAEVIWGTILIIGIATYGIRLSFIYLFGHLETIPPRVSRVLRFVPAAVLAALVLPALLTVGPTAGDTLFDPRLAAGAIAAVVAWRTENVLLTIGVGMGALWLFKFLLFG